MLVEEFYERIKQEELKRLEHLREINRENMPRLFDYERKALEKYESRDKFKKIALLLYKNETIISHEDSQYYSRQVAKYGDISDVMFLKECVVDIDMPSIEKRILESKNKFILFNAIKTTNGNYIPTEKIAQALSKCGETEIGNSLLDVSKTKDKGENLSM